MSFARVRGQSGAAAQMAAALKGGRLAHAYLLTGPEGVGKRTLARELARAALCETGRKTGDACDRCPDCRAVDSGNSPDLSVLAVERSEGEFRPIEPSDREIKVASIRLLQRELMLKGPSGRTRAWLVPGAERMNEEAANALLKTLEEPPPGRLLILTSARPEALLPTVLSRVARVRLRSLSAREVEDCLVELHGKTRAEARELALAAGGSVGAALAASVEQVRRARAFVAETWGTGRLPQPLAFSDAMMEFARSAAGGRGKTLEDVRRELLGLWGVARACCRQALLAAAGAQAAESAAAALAGLGPERLARAAAALLSADRAVRDYVSPELACRVLAGELAALGR